MYHRLNSTVDFSCIDDETATVNVTAPLGPEPAMSRRSVRPSAVSGEMARYRIRPLIGVVLLLADGASPRFSAIHREATAIPGMPAGISQPHRDIAR
jgi:hypothetical protein